MTCSPGSSQRVNFSKNVPGCVAAVVTGLALASSGFLRNQSQPGTVLLAMRLLLSLLPLACYALGSALFLGFGLDRAEHTRVQREIATRSCVAAA